MLMPKHIAGRWLAARFSLTPAEAERLINHPKRERVLRRLEDWRDQCGLPDTRSPLVRGYLQELMRDK
jgi:hypothetical protein